MAVMVLEKSKFSNSDKSKFSNSDKSKFSNFRCLNCDKYGHLFKHCTNPIVSYGIIGYKIIDGQLKFLLIQRKDTIGYTDFVRGKYSNPDLLKVFVQEMTNEEKYNLLTKSFDEIWDDLWISKQSGIYVNEKQKAKRKFNELNISDLVDTSESRYKTQEFGFPKGRKNLRETSRGCAIREFKEETGYGNGDFIIQDRLPRFEESFTGSNNIKYTHIYFLAHVISDKIPEINSTQQMEEVRHIGFYDYKTAYKLMRDYDTQKRHVLTKVNELLS